MTCRNQRQDWTYMTFNQKINLQITTCKKFSRTFECSREKPVEKKNLMRTK